VQKPAEKSDQRQHFRQKQQPRQHFDGGRERPHLIDEKENDERIENRPEVPVDRRRSIMTPGISASDTSAAHSSRGASG
jgi:hypothetical protein